MFNLLLACIYAMFSNNLVHGKGRAFSQLIRAVYLNYVAVLPREKFQSGQASVGVWYNRRYRSPFRLPVDYRLKDSLLHHLRLGSSNESAIHIVTSYCCAYELSLFRTHAAVSPQAHYDKLAVSSSPASPCISTSCKGGS